MTTQNPSQPGDLFFEPIVETYLSNPRFLRRDWLAAEVNERLGMPGCRFVLLTAAPGAGKSTFMAQLAKDHDDWPRYFIRRDQRTPLGDVGAHSFLLRIGFQLAARYPEAFAQENLELAVQQRIGIAEAGSEVVGAEVKRIIASPFYRKVLSIQQEIAQSNGRVVGLRVEELVVESQLLDLSQLAVMAIVDPARALFKLHPEEHIVILVDALDETRYHDTQDNILKWLTNCPELPPNVRFVLSSRPPDTALKLFCEKQKPYLKTLTIEPQDRNVQNDTRTYVRKLVAKPDVAQEVIRAGEKTVEVFADQLAGKANGNLGYLDALARAIDDAVDRQDAAALAALLTLSDLPDDLEDLYAFFLHQIRADVETKGLAVAVSNPGSPTPLYLPAWQALYQPVLGVLAVALAPLSPEQVTTFGGTGIDRTFVLDALGRLRQFLDEADGRYRLYHATVAEFLTGTATRDSAKTADLFTDPVQWHGRIATWYWTSCFDKEAGRHTWNSCDDYGLASLPVHLNAAGDPEHHLRALLVDFDWLHEKLSRSGIHALLGDYELALAGVTLTPTDKEALSLLQRGLRLSAHILAVDKLELAGQLIGRLLISDHPLIQALRKDILQHTAYPWLQPLTSALLQATSPIVFVLSSHAYPVRAVAVTPDGKRALSAAEDRTLKVWDVETGEDLHTLRGHTDSVLAVAVDPDGRWAVSGSQDKTVRVWDLESAEQVLCIQAHDQAVSAVAITPDGLQIVSGSYDATVKVWELKTGVYCKTLHGHAGGVNALALTLDGSRLVSGSYDRTVKLWDLDSGQVIQTFHGHQDQVSAVAISPEGRWLVSASFDRTLKLWDLETKGELHAFSGHNDVVTSVAVGPTGRIVSTSWDTTLRVWDLARRASIGVFEGHCFRVHGVAITSDGRRAISASGDTTLNVWDLTMPMPPQPLSGRAGFLTAIAVTPDGRFAVSSAHDQATPIFKVWDLRAGVEVHTATGYLDYSQDGLHLRSAGFSQALQVRNLQTGTEAVLSLGGWMDRKTLFLPNGQPLKFRGLRTPVVLLVAPGSSETVRTFEGHTSDVYDVAVTPDGTRLITTSNDRTLGIWELDTGKKLAFLSGHTREIWSISVAQDGRTAVSSSDDRSVILWDLERRRSIARFSADCALTACAISPDGQTVTTGDEAGRMHILRLERFEYYGCEGVLS